MSRTRSSAESAGPFVLLHSPLVGVSSLAPTARALEQRGLVCHLPQLPSSGAGVPQWQDCPRHLLEVVPRTEAPILAGHSAAGLLAAALAPALSAAGLIFLDAGIAPGGGATPPVEPEFLQYVRRLPRQNGLLPPWSEWWGQDIFAGARVDPALQAAFEAEQPRLPVTWFDDSFEMPDWSGCRAAYLQTSALFAGEADEARRRGWPVVCLNGTHLHPFLEPEETAEALVALGRECVAGSAGV